MTTRGLVEQSELITAQIRQMLVDPGISPSDIVVLVSSSENSSRMKAELAQKKISNSIKWTANHRQNPDEVLIETVKRFKGLEARIVILWLDDGGIVPIGGEELYVGASRARSQLLIISTMNALETKVG
jgi:superfamily I DNA and RNA helicase